MDDYYFHIGDYDKTNNIQLYFLEKDYWEKYHAQNYEAMPDIVWEMIPEWLQENLFECSENTYEFTYESNKVREALLAAGFKELPNPEMWY